MKSKFFAYYMLFLIACIPFYQNHLFSTNTTMNQFENNPLTSNTQNNESWAIDVPGIHKMIIDSEDNIYVAGFTGEFETAGITLSKYLPSGDLLWHKIWDEYDREELRTLTLDNSGNIYIVGNTESYATFEDVLILKYQSNGNLLWNMTWGGPDFDRISGFKIDSEDNFYIVIYDNYEWTQDFRVLKFNSSGVKIWDKTRVELGKQVLYHIGIDASDNLFFSYKTEYDDEETWFFLKYDHSGNQLWISEKEEIGSLKNFGVGIDRDDNIILRGYNNESQCIQFFKYNTSGNQIWNKTILTPYGYKDCFDNEGNYYLSRINYTNSKGYIVKYNSTLEQIWNSNYQKGEYTGGLLVDNDQNVYVIADISIPSEMMYDDIYITKFNASGNFLFNLTWGGSAWDDIRASQFDSINNLYLIIRSYTTSGYKYYLVKNPIDNNKSLQPGEPGPRFYDMYLIIFVTFVGLISFLSLLIIIKPRLKNQLKS